MNTRALVPMRDTKALQADNACSLRRSGLGKRGKRTAGANSTRPCRGPQPRQHSSTGDHGTNTPFPNVARSPIRPANATVNCITALPVVNAKPGRKRVNKTAVFAPHSSLRKDLFGWEAAMKTTEARADFNAV